MERKDGWRVGGEEIGEERGGEREMRCEGRKVNITKVGIGEREEGRGDV